MEGGRRRTGGSGPGGRQGFDYGWFERERCFGENGGVGCEMEGLDYSGRVVTLVRGTNGGHLCKGLSRRHCQNLGFTT